MTKLLLEDIIIEAVRKLFFEDNRTVFSCFDVTKKIREMVNTGDFEIEPSTLPVSHRLNTRRQAVYHSDIRDTIHALLSNIDLYLDLSSEKTFDGTKFIYSFKEVVEQKGDTKDKNLVVSFRKSRQNENDAPFVVSFKGTGDQIKVIDKGAIRDYLERKGAATIKQIQSRLKRENPPTCKEIFEQMKGDFESLEDDLPFSLRVMVPVLKVD